MTCAKDIISSAMRKIGVLSGGEVLQAVEGQDALKTLVQMIDAWTNEILMIPVISVITHKLNTNSTTYTIGIKKQDKIDKSCRNQNHEHFRGEKCCCHGSCFCDLSDFDKEVLGDHIQTARPERILTAFIRDEYATDYHLKVIDNAGYARISRKNNVARPSGFYFRKGFPFHEIIFESLPFANDTLHIECIQPLAEIIKVSELNDEINLPSGYEKALIYNLCIDLADEWGKQVSQIVYQQAIESKRQIKRANYRDIVLGMDRALITNNRSKGTFIIESF